MKINPQKTPITGYESPICTEILISIMIGILEGDEIPPVTLYTFDGGKTYEIPYPERAERPNADGGHHRCFAAFLLQKELAAEISDTGIGFNGFKTPIPDGLGYPLLKINFHSNPDTFLHQTQHYYYRPLPPSEKLFTTYPQIPKLLSLCADTYERMLRAIGRPPQACEYTPAFLRDRDQAKVPPSSRTVRKSIDLLDSPPPSLPTL